MLPSIHLIKMFNIPPFSAGNAGAPESQNEKDPDPEITAASAHELIASRDLRDREGFERKSKAYEPKSLDDLASEKQSKSLIVTGESPALQNENFPADEKHHDSPAHDQNSSKASIVVESVSPEPQTDEAEHHSVSIKNDASPERTLTREEEIEEALNCPCIDAMKEGPCGGDFISAYRCFLESDTEPKGMDCVDKFAAMQTCMADHPEEYNLDDDEKSNGDSASPIEKLYSDDEAAKIASIESGVLESSDVAQSTPVANDASITA